MGKLPTLNSTVRLQEPFGLNPTEAGPRYRFGPTIHDGPTRATGTYQSTMSRWFCKSLTAVRVALLDMRFPSPVQPYELATRSTFHSFRSWGQQAGHFPRQRYRMKCSSDASYTTDGQETSKGSKIGKDITIRGEDPSMRHA